MTRSLIVTGAAFYLLIGCVYLAAAYHSYYWQPGSARRDWERAPVKFAIGLPLTALLWPYFIFRAGVAWLNRALP